MKKLMIAAAIAAMTAGAFAADVNNGSAYYLRFNLATLKADGMTCRDKSGCVLCGYDTEGVTNYYRSTKRQLKAVLAKCVECGEAVTNLNTFAFAMWEEAYATNYTKKIDYTQALNTIATSTPVSTYGNIDVKGYGEQGEYCTVVGALNTGWVDTANYNALLNFVGFGNLNSDGSSIRSASGSVVGQLQAQKYKGFYAYYVTRACISFKDLCKNPEVLVADTASGLVPAWGVWTLRRVDDASNMTLKEIMGNGRAIMDAAL